ncbi:HNH family endonuclease [Methanonatronarchaeum thermophilum]|uniref:HNH family endonuclease n=1 Tax=Methanonatronarchaeum thermophilum TaxID=1927129 RepID=A0A1Y3GI14_9EURY|nr:hypothetical protein [Methanonatronarchaeum thermophilum]OUJ19026.1 HNH family endonuclease [Methanonatronarchaeum thermophilum]
MGGGRYSKEELIELLRENSNLTQSEWRQREDLPSLGSLQRHFGSWNEAREAAGLEVRGKRYSKEKLLELLRENPDISLKEWQERDDLPSYSTILRHFGSWREAKEAIGREPEVVSSYSKEELLNILKRELGENPDLTYTKWNERDDLPSAQTISNHFGSWDKARQAAGFKPYGFHPYSYSDDKLLEILKKHPDLDAEDFKKIDDLPSSTTYSRRFGSWNKARKKAGLPERGHGRDFIEYDGIYFASVLEACVYEKLKTYGLDIKTHINKKEAEIDFLVEDKFYLEPHSVYYNPETIEEYEERRRKLVEKPLFAFKKLSELEDILRQQNLEEIIEKKEVKNTEVKEKVRREGDFFDQEKLINLIKENPELTSHEWRKRKDLPSLKTITRCFGSWNNFRTEANLKTRFKRRTKEELLKKIKKEPNLSINKWNERDDLPSSTQVINKFGSWNKFKKEAGIKPQIAPQNKYTRKKLIELIQENPELTRNKWVERDDLPSETPVTNKFGSWNNFRREAGLKPIQKNWSKEELLKLIKKHPNLTQNEWRKKEELPSVDPIYRIFGSWNNFRKEAGLKLHKKDKKHKKTQKTPKKTTLKDYF